MPSIELLKIFREFKIKVVISDYTDALPYLKKAVEKFIKCIKDSEIDYEISKTDKWIDFGYDILNTNDSEDKLTELFNSCKMPCRLIQGGKLYYCANSKFAINAEMNELDHANVYDLSNLNKDQKRILMEFDNGYNDIGYINMCKKCNGYLSINTNYVEVAKQVPRITKTDI